jgi:type VI secretion system protein ImpB
MSSRKESSQKKLERNQPPRVNIVYEVDTGNGIVMVELPFIVGVVGDFSGHPKGQRDKLKDRNFINIDRDNFNDVMAGIKPRLAFRVDNKLSENKDSELNVELEFESINDFKPDSIVNRYGPLKKVMAKRRRLTEILTRIDGNDRLEELLQAVVENTEAQKELGAALARKSPAPDAKTEAKSDE